MQNPPTGEGRRKGDAVTHAIWRRTWRSKGLRLLLTIDLFFVGLHLLRFWLLQEDFRLGLLSSGRFRVDVDRGFAESFQYLKLLLITGFLSFLWAKQKRLSYGAWAAVFAFAGLDDALRLHEGLGGRLVRALDIPAAFGLRGQDFGELLVWGSFGVVLLGFVLFSYLRAAPEERAFSKNLALLFGVFVLFGLGVDMLHILLGSSAIPQTFMAVLEDGGEMLSVSVLSVFTWVRFRFAAAPQAVSGGAQEAPESA